MFQAWILVAPVNLFFSYAGNFFHIWRKVIFRVSPIKEINKSENNDLVNVLKEV
jgi:hypothetical protein